MPDSPRLSIGVPGENVATAGHSLSTSDNEAKTAVISLCEGRLMSALATDLDAIRAQFPALSRQQNGQPVCFFDGPAGSQVPQRVADAVSGYLINNNANHGAPFATSAESDAILHQAHKAVADFFGTPDADCIAFGPNMTTLTLSLSRAIGKTWQPGDEILLSRLDHDANVTPWVLAAQDAGATVQHIDIRPEDCTLNMDDLAAKLTPKTKLVAVAYASNATGTINPLPTIIEQSHAVGAQVFIDAVHYAPHGLIDVTELDCDFLAASAYKFFGPHVGMMYGKRSHLESLTPYKLRPSTNELPGRWMTGTQNHEGIAGTAQAVEYVAELGRTLNSDVSSRREALQHAFAAITEYEQGLARDLIKELQQLPGLKIWGITNEEQLTQRVPTISVTHDTQSPLQLAKALSERGIFVWHGNHYALPFTEAVNLEPGGTLRIGLLHYNTKAETARLITALREILGS